MQSVLARIALGGLTWVGYLLAVGPASGADASPGPVGSAFLRTLSVQDPPFGRLLYDGYPWDGVRMQRWRRDQPEVDWLMVWIDLQTPGLGYRVTPVHYRPGPDGLPQQAVFAQTTLDFLEQHSDPPRVDLAINTVAFEPFPAFHGLPVILKEPVWQGDDRHCDPEPDSVMLGLLSGRAVLDEVDVVRAAQPVVAFGSFRLAAIPKAGAVRKGQVIVEDGDPYGRTLAGISADGRVLILLIADGYNPGVSVGFNLGDAARVLQAAGAYQGMFLDGGGSSTLVGREADGRSVVVNRPAGLQKTPGTLRYIGANLGFTNLRRTEEPLPTFENWQAPFHVVMWNKTFTWARVYPYRAVMAGVIGFFVLGLAAWRVWRWRRRRRLISAPVS